MSRVRKYDIVVCDTDTGEVKNKVSKFYVQGNHENIISLFASFLRRVEQKPAGFKFTFQCSVSDYCKTTDVLSEPKLFDNIPSIF